MNSGCKIGLSQNLWVQLHPLYPRQREPCLNYGPEKQENGEKENLDIPSSRAQCSYTKSHYSCRHVGKKILKCDFILPQQDLYNI